VYISGLMTLCGKFVKDLNNQNEKRVVEIVSCFNFWREYGA